MDCLAQFVVPRHVVPLDSNRLSPMQAALHATTSPCVIASAPTGSGKSYVYQRLVAEGQRVLFVVPTIQLAEESGGGHGRGSGPEQGSGRLRLQGRGAHGPGLQFRGHGRGDRVRFNPCD